MPVKKKGFTFRAYVECNGQRVDAIYQFNSEYSVTLGANSYSVTAVDTALAGHVVVPDSVKSPDGKAVPVTGVSRHSFADCRHITGVTLPDSIHDIGDQSFMNCRSLGSIVLPPGTRYLWPYAFRGCSSLNRIVVKAAVPPDSYNDVFDERTLRFATLLVPAASAGAFRHAFVWNMFRYSLADWDR